jgi:rhodanese-related sulfurtransferase
MAPMPESRPHPKKEPPAMRLARIVARLIMAGIFVYASLDKIAHPAAFANDVYNYQILPDTFVNLTALVLPWLELFLGLCLLAGIWLPGAVLTANGLLVVFLAALVFNLARGLDVNCGCFGSDGLGPSMSAGGYLLRDMGFFAVAIFMLYAVLRPPLVASKAIWCRAAWHVPALVILSVAAALAVNALRADRLPLAGDFSVTARMTTATGERLDITLEEAQKLFFTHAAVFIDARSVEDYAKGRIQGALSLPWHDVDLNFIGVTQNLDVEAQIVTYCDGETCELSHDLALFLREAGFLKTRVLVNGWTLWQQAGLPVESGTP